MINFYDWQHALTALFVILFIGLFISKLTEKPRLPDVAAYLLFGIVAGPFGFKLISEPSNSQVNQFILSLGATLIVFDGGQAVNLRILQRVWRSVVLLSTLGVLVSAAVIAVSAHIVAGVSWTTSLLLGGVTASTDPATLMPVFRRVPILARLQQTIESESAFNDATGSVLVFTILGVVSSHAHFDLMTSLLAFFHLAFLGILVGILFGFIALWLTSLDGLGLLHEFGSIVFFVTAIGAFEVAQVLQASGIMAAFAAGVVSGNGKNLRLGLPQHTAENVKHFSHALTFIMRTLIFVLLGTQVDFRLVGNYLWVGLFIVFVLMFVARPLTVLSSTLIDRSAKWTWREIVFMFWTRETGVIPAALAGMLVAEHIGGSQLIASITFLSILVTILVQASTTGFVARKLGLLSSATEEDI